MSDLDQRLLQAHERGDTAALVALYAEAAASRPADSTAWGFYMTQAYIYALDTGSPEASALHDRLRRAGREA